MEEEKIENACEAPKKECCCKKAKCVCKIILLIWLLVLTSVIFNINKNLDILLDVTGIRAQVQAKSQNSFLISKKYDKGQSFEKALKTEKPIIMWFYVDWCGYCKRFAPTFDKLVKDGGIKDKFAVAFVNCDDEKNADLVKEYQIQGYPSVFLVNPKTGQKEQLDGQDFFVDDAFYILKDKLLAWNK